MGLPSELTMEPAHWLRLQGLCMCSEPLLPLFGRHSATPEGFHALQMTSLRTFGSGRTARLTGGSCFLVTAAHLAGGSAGKLHVQRNKRWLVWACFSPPRHP